MWRLLKMQWPVLATAVACLVIGQLAVAPAAAQSSVVHKFRQGQDFQGTVQGATFDARGDAWLATPNRLLKVENNRLKEVDGGRSRDRLLLASGGERYAWLTGGRAPFGRFDVELVDLDAPIRPIAELQSATYPRGFNTIHVGSRGNLLVGATPVQDVEGLKGEFIYTFWDADGGAAKSVSLDGPRVGVLNEAADAILLLGQADAVSFDKNGASLWRVPGSYRKAVLATGGNLALLNPGQAIDELHLVRGGQTLTIKLPAPVHELAITPDGNLAAIAMSKGQLAWVKLRSCDSSSCPLINLVLPVTVPHSITAVRFIDDGILAIGLVHVTGTLPHVEYLRGEVLVVKTSGDVLFQHAISLPQPATVSPMLDATFGSRLFSAYTRDEAIYVRVRN